MAVNPPKAAPPPAGIGGLIGPRRFVPRREGIAGPADGTPRKPDTSLTLADPTITGALAPDVVRAVVRRHLNQIHDGYQRELVKARRSPGSSR